MSSIAPSPPHRRSEALDEAVSDAPLRFGPRTRKRSTETTANLLAEKPSIEALPSTKSEVQARSRRRIGWVAGLGAASVSIAAVAVLSPSPRHPFVELTQSDVRIGAVSPSSPGVQTTEWRLDALLESQLHLEFERDLAPAVQSEVIPLTYPLAHEALAQLPAVPRLPTLSGSFQDTNSHSANDESHAAAAEKKPLEHEQISASAPQAPAFLREIALSESSSSVPSAAPTLPQGMLPRVIIRFDKSSYPSRRRAEIVADALKEEGIEVAHFQMAASPVQTKLNFYYAPDEAVALKVGRLAGVRPVRRVQARDGLQFVPGSIELSLTGG